MLTQIRRATKTYFDKMKKGGLAKPCAVSKRQDSYDPNSGGVLPDSVPLAETLIISHTLTVKEMSEMGDLGFSIPAKSQKGILMRKVLDPHGLQPGDIFNIDGEIFHFVSVLTENAATFEVLLRPTT